MAVHAAAVSGLRSSDDDQPRDSEESATTVGESTSVEMEGDEPAGCEDDTGLVIPARRSPSALLLAGIVTTIAVVALGVLTGCLGYRAYQSHQQKAERVLFLQVARQGAVNLSTIDYQHADTDVQRILDSATGRFHDEFAERAKPFVEVVKQTKSTSNGTVAEAGLESVAGDEAQALVAVSVTSSVAGGPQQPPKSWRMRLTLQKSGNDVKVSNVEFVP
jgi:Mce-associated membrane protein